MEKALSYALPQLKISSTKDVSQGFFWLVDKTRLVTTCIFPFDELNRCTSLAKTRSSRQWRAGSGERWPLRPSSSSFFRAFRQPTSSFDCRNASPSLDGSVFMTRRTDNSWSLSRLLVLLNDPLYRIGEATQSTVRILCQNYLLHPNQHPHKQKWSM